MTTSTTLPHIHAWIDSNLSPSAYPEEGNTSEAEAYAKALESDSKEQGITRKQMEQDLGESLEDYIQSQIIQLIDDEVARQVANDRS